MSISDLATTYVHASTSAIVSGKSDDTQNEMVDELITRIKQGSDEVRTEAWLSVCEIGAATVKPLAGLMAEKLCYQTKICGKMHGWRWSGFPARSRLRHLKPR